MRVAQIVSIKCSRQVDEVYSLCKGTVCSDFLYLFIFFYRLIDVYVEKIC